MEKNNKIVKKSEIFARLLNCAILFRAFFFLYSFASFAYWFYKILNSNKDLPNSIKMILDLVFFVKEEDSIGISLPLLIIASFALLFGFFMDFCINHLYQKIDILQEEEANELLLRKMERQKAKEKRRQRFEEEQRRLSSHQNMSPNMPNMQSMQDNNDLQMGEMTEAQENAMFEMPTIDLVQNVKNLKYVDLDNVHLLFLVEPRICKIKKNKEDVDLTFEKLELWKKRINKSILEAVIYSQPLQRGFYRKNLFLIYRSFNYIDDFIYFIKPALDSITIEYRKYGISVSFCYVLSALINLDFLEQELDCMDTVFSLDFFNALIATHTFKSSYDNKKNHRYSISFKGEYNLSKNLTITNIQPLYQLEERMIKEM